MANHLTGDYDAVVQIAVRQINALLGTLHQNGIDAKAPLQLLHSARLRVGNRRRPFPDVVGFGEWVMGFQQVRSPIPAADLRGQLIGTAPPGAARLMREAFRAFDEWVNEIPPDVVRGTVDAQVASVTISVPDGSSSEVTTHAYVRARYMPDTNTSAAGACSRRSTRCF